MCLGKADEIIMTPKQFGAMQGGFGLAIENTFVGLPDESVVSSVNRQQREVYKLVRGQGIERGALHAA